jgi:Holliday junction resolvase RusA-like endonuclease
MTRFSEEWLQEYQKSRYQKPPAISPLEQAINDADPDYQAEKQSLAEARSAMRNKQENAQKTKRVYNPVEAKLRRTIKKSIDKERNETPVDNTIYEMTLSYPPLLNSLYRGYTYAEGNTRVILSAEGRQFKKSVATEVQSQFPRKPFLHSVAVTIKTYRPRKAGDVDSILKIVLDALNKVVYLDDEQVNELHVYRTEDKNYPRVELQIMETE